MVNQSKQTKHDYVCRNNCELLLNQFNNNNWGTKMSWPAKGKEKYVYKRYSLTIQVENNL